jgi:hypothetical protein
VLLRDEHLQSLRVNGDTASARSCRSRPNQLPPSSPPAMTSVPAGARARRSRGRDEFPPMSMTTSYVFVPSAKSSRV